MWTALQQIASRLRAYFGSSRLDRDLNQELESHVAMAAADHIRSGMTEEHARRAARLEFGGVAQLREQHRSARGLPLLDNLRQDLRYTFRTLRRDAAFTTFAILIAGLGIGASSTIFGVVNALLLRPLPFTDSKQLVWVATIGDDGISEWAMQVGHVLDLREQTKTVSDLAGYFGFSKGNDNKLEGEPRRLTGVPVSYNFFPLLGVQPVAGRLFSREECNWNGPRAVLLSYSLWKSRYALDPAS